MITFFLFQNSLYRILSISHKFQRMTIVLAHDHLHVFQTLILELVGLKLVVQFCSEYRKVAPFGVRMSTLESMGLSSMSNNDINIMWHLQRMTYLPAATAAKTSCCGHEHELFFLIIADRKKTSVHASFHL